MNLQNQNQRESELLDIHYKKEAKMAWTPTYDTVNTYGGTTSSHLFNGISSQRMFDLTYKQAFLELVPNASKVVPLASSIT